MPPTQEDHAEIKRLLEENSKLIQENSKLVKKLYKGMVISGILTLVWYALLIGLPFALYFYVLGPYFEAFGSNYETFRMGIGELPGLKGMENLLPPIQR